MLWGLMNMVNVVISKSAEDQRCPHSKKPRKKRSRLFRQEQTKMSGRLRKETTQVTSPQKPLKHVPSELVQQPNGIGILLALEPRIMFDGAALLTGAEVAQDQAHQDQPTQEIEGGTESEGPANALTDNIDLFSALSSVSAHSERREIVFIDTSVDDYHTLLEGVNPEAETILLDSSQDGIEQMAEILRDRSEIDAIHIISHGNQGELQLGTGRLNEASMQGGYADELSIINQALTEEADFLIYGCNFGEGEIGEEAVSLLAKLTGADIAASNDLTGSLKLGGDWDLERSTGTIETSIVVSTQAQESWQSLLAPLVRTDEFTVNTTPPPPPVANEETSGFLRGAERAVDIAPNGDYVVVWTDGASNDVFAKVLDRDGSEKVGQFRVNTSLGNNAGADVAVADNGSFVVTWTHANDIAMTRFNANGSAVDGADVIVNTTVSNIQQNASINMNGAGNFVIAWEGNGGSDEGIFVRQGSFIGGLTGSVITVDATAATQGPSVGIADSGDFVVAYDDGAGDVWFQRFNSGGVLQNAAQQVDAQAGAGGVAVDMIGDGRFTIAYRGTVLDLGVYSRQYDALGTPLTATPQVVNTSIFGNQTSPSVSMDDTGAFVVVWEGNGQGDSDGVFGQRFDSSGTKIDSEFLINQTTVNVQDRASVAMLDQDNFVVVWTGNDGSQTDVFARQYASNNPPSFNGLDNTPTFTEGGAAVVLDGNATIADSDLDAADNYSGATLTLTRNGVANAEDVFDGPGTLSEGGNLVLDTTTIGTVTTNSGGILVLTFNNNATTTQVNSMLQQITYANNSPTPPANVQINFTINDGNTGSQGSGVALTDTGSITVTIDATNNPPTATPDTYTIDEDTTLTTEPVWFDVGWQSRQKLTFNNTAQTENLVDFPVLITLDAGKIDYTKVQNAGEDLRFVDADGTELAYEIESWNESGTSNVWVKVPQINGASGTDYIWMYYDNASATDNQNVAGVWSNNFEALSHLHDDFNDSTGNAHNGINNGSSDITGNIGDGQSFDGVNDRIDISSGAGIDNIFTGGATVSAWINPSGWGEAGFGRILDKSDGISANNGWALQVENAGDQLLFEVGFSGPIGRWRSPINSISLDTWQLVTLVYDSTSDANDPTIYVNGVPVGITEENPQPSGAANSDAGLALAIGNRSGSTDRTFQGIIDEVRIETGTRSDDWIQAQYLSMTDSLVTFATVEGPGSVLANDTDAESDPLTAIQVSANPANAQSFTFNADGSFSYTPVTNFTGVDTFTYKVNDGTVDGNTVVVTINVNPVNDTPTIATNTGRTVNEGSSGNVLTTAMLNEGDPDDAGTGLTYTVTAVTTNGTLRLSGTALSLNHTFTQDDIDNNRVTYDHNGSETTTDNFNFSLADGGENGAVPATGTFNLTVDSVNDPPVFTGLDNTPSFTEGGAPVVLDTNATIADPELDTANYIGATLTLIRNGGANTEDLFDGSGTLNPLVESGNVVVGVTTIGTVTTNSGGRLTLTFNGNANTLLVNSALRQITYANSSITPPGNVQINFTIDDGNSGSQGSGPALNDVGSITVTINSLNALPVAMADGSTVNEGSINTLDLAGNDTDSDDGLDLTSLAIISGPTNGTITSINTDGTVEYTHNGSETLSDSFTYTINDLAGATSNTATVNLTVTPQNDAPIITSDGSGANASISILTGNTAATAVNAFDAEGSPLTYSIGGGADAALFTIDPATGALTFISAPNIQTPGDVGSDNVYDVIVRASDGTLTDTQAIAVTITDVPVVVLPPTTDPSPESPSESGEEDAGESEDEVSGNVLLAGSNSHGHGSSSNQSSTGDNPNDSNQLNHLAKDNVALMEHLREGNGITGSVGDLMGLFQQSYDKSTLKSQISSLLRTSSGFLKDLDQARDALNNVVATEKTYVASSIAASTGLSVGYVFWLLRSGVLLTALLSSVPAWQFVNPLLVLDIPTKKKRLKGQEDPEDDSVESMFENRTVSDETIGNKAESKPHADQSRETQRIKR